MKKIIPFIIGLTILTFASIFFMYKNLQTLFLTSISLTFIATILIFLFFGWIKLNDKNLFRQPLFWLSIGAPAYYFLIIGGWAWKEFALSITAHGFNNFLEISKLPLLILASSVPLAAIVNNIHRTIQTEKQITESEKKNLSDSYYNHFKNTLDLLKGIESKEIKTGLGNNSFTLKVSNPVSVYHKIFINSNAVNGAQYIPDTHFVNNIIALWEEIHRCLDKLQHYSYHSNKDHKIVYRAVFIYLYKLEKNYENVCHALTLNALLFDKRPVYKTQKLQYTGLFYEHEHLIFAVRELHTVCIKILDIINPQDLEQLKEKITFSTLPYFSHYIVMREDKFDSILNKVELIRI